MRPVSMSTPRPNSQKYGIGEGENPVQCGEDILRVGAMESYCLGLQY